jgi:hypothetical protein
VKREPTAVAGEAGGSAATGTPKVLRWAIGLFTVDTLLVWLYLAFLLYSDASAEPTDRRAAALVTAYFAAYALAFGGINLALARHKRWARGPAIVLQLMAAAIGYYMIAGGLALAGVPLLLLALAGAGLLLAPASREALGVR